MKNYLVDNLKNYFATKGWICGQMLPEGLSSHNDKLEININTIQPGFTAGEHFHPKSEMVIYVLKGRIKMIFDGEVKEMLENDFVYCRPGVHETVAEVIEPTTLLCVRTPSVKDNKIEVK